MFWLFIFKQMYINYIAYNPITQIMNLSSPEIALEIIASQFRTTKHNAQRQMRKIIKRLLNLKHKRKEGEGIGQALSESKEQLICLKRKLSSSCEQQSKYYDICKKRIHKQQQLSKNNDSKLQFELNTQIMQYLYNRCDFQKAKQLQTAFDQQLMFNIQTQILERCFNIITDIKNNRLESLSQWIYENNHNLDKIQSPIQFQLVSCEFINLINEGQIIPACSLLRKELKKMKLNVAQQQTIEKLSYLLIDQLTNPPNIQPFLYKLEATFRNSISLVYSINFSSPLQKKLVIGLSALKTICCMKTETRNGEICPICCGRSIRLSQKIPMLTKESSVFICRINGSLMDEQNHPVALPSGQIYSITGLNETQENDLYYCFITQTWYPKNLARKVFLA